MKLRTCVSPSGRFVWGVHKPVFRVENLRACDYQASLGSLEDGTPIDNAANFPPGDIDETAADWIYEIPNAFPFRGATYISRSHADRCARNPQAICLPKPPRVSLEQVLKDHLPATSTTESELAAVYRALPEPVQVCLAGTSTDAHELIRLVHMSCEMVMDGDPPQPLGLRYTRDLSGNPRPKIHNMALYEVLANNPHLPDAYKLAMVLRPGIQGASEIVGELGGAGEPGHVFEYLRRNSYIPWGHFAANMAHDAVRYRMADLTPADMRAMRHLYYQRTYLRLARALGIVRTDDARRSMSCREIDILRMDILKNIKKHINEKSGAFNSTLWGWNFGFDYAPSHYRLHASHQQIHQQYALVPNRVTVDASVAVNGVSNTLPSFACGDLVADVIDRYRQETGHNFFDCYLNSIKSNVRIDNDISKPAELIVHEDRHVLLFVPKAQTSQWELQLMTKGKVGNVLEADRQVRSALDHAMWLALTLLEAMGARMVTNIELSKRFGAAGSDQRLLYSFLPKMPYAMGAFSEAQMRWINRHYPEDFAEACRCKMIELSLAIKFPAA